ncbi:MAG: hemerythrin domain-containing protein [Candidatus Omnitrophica bacterium]|nr:hemerythrin domain-containing protein [Candidatus Omnitrophota bacterium]MDD5553985.1 hemerythrin domain-containing protein [Candidatus Omnitrophota bacterium]
MKRLLTALLLLAGAVFLVMPLQAQEGQFGQGATYSEIMRNDHRQIERLIGQLRQSEDHGEMDRLLTQLKDGLAKHMKAEETYLYPALEKNDDTKGMAVKARDEHSAAKSQLQRINHMAGREEYLSRLDLLETLIKSHVNFEEGELLSAAQGVVEEGSMTEQFRKVYR